MNYKEMWKRIKRKFNLQVEYHKLGAMQSMAKSIREELKYTEILKPMNQLEYEGKK